MSKLIDLTGNKYGRLTVLHRDTERIAKGSSYWICQCDCGNIKSVKSSALRRGEIQSCGCLRNERASLVKKEKNEQDMIGKRFGKLTVLARSERTSFNGTRYWLCQCDCGKQKEIIGTNLKQGNTVSCGCYHRSMGAIKILSILTEHNINFIDEYVFTDLPKNYYDFALLDSDNQVVRLIEFDGEQHFKDIPAWGGLELQQKRDKIKNEYALSHNIPLIRIPYWERDNITLEMLLGEQYLVKS